MSLQQELGETPLLLRLCTLRSLPVAVFGIKVWSVWSGWRQNLFETCQQPTLQLKNVPPGSKTCELLRAEGEGAVGRKQAYMIQMRCCASIRGSCQEEMPSSELTKYLCPAHCICCEKG